MTIRSFQSEDEAIFLDLCSEFYNAHATLRPYNEKIAKKTFERVLAKHENLWGYLLSDKETGVPVGYALLTSYWCNEEGGNILVLDELFIRPTDRHKGYASAFMEWMEKTFRGEMVSITLEVLTTNVNACHLYVKEGYRPDGFTTYTKTIATDGEE